MNNKQKVSQNLEKDPDRNQIQIQMIKGNEMSIHHQKNIVLQTIKITVQPQYHQKLTKTQANLPAHPYIPIQNYHIFK